MGEDCQHEDAYWDSCQQLDTASQRIADLEAEMAAEREQRDAALRILYEHMGGPNPSTLVPAVRLVTENALKTTRLCVEVSARHQEAARAAEVALATERRARREAEDTAHRYRSRTHLAEEREAALRARLVVLTTGNASDFGATGNNDVLLALQRYARATLSQPSPAVERIQALEEEHKLALTLCQRIDDTVGDVKDFAECVDRQHAAYEAWRTVVEKVGEE